MKQHHLSLVVVLVLILLITCSTSAVVVDAQTPPTITTQCGKIVGTWESVKNEFGNETRRVAKFLGLPYAQPPVGAFRFAAPQPAMCWDTPTGEYNATYERSMCLQQGFSSTGVTGSEDCLYLNVYVPENIYNKIGNTTNNNVALSPVSVYTYGGSNIEGSAPPQTFFAAFVGGADGVVAVTISGYRLATLGYLAAPSMTSFNFGIQDQIMALQWVQGMISQFGGDPSKVTVSGQSSGGTNIFAMMCSRKTQGLFRAAFSMSGSPNISMSKRAKLMQDTPLIQQLGCDFVNPSVQMQCLRSLPAEKLIAATPNSWNTPGLWSLDGISPEGRQYAGLLFVDGDVIEMPFSLALQTLHRNVTLIISSNGQENDLVPPDQNVNNIPIVQWRQFLRSAFKPWADATVPETIYNLYETEATENPQLAYDSIVSDYGINCASPRLAVQATRTTSSPRSAPIYISVNQWPPQNPGAPSANSSNTFEKYAFHTWFWGAAIAWFLPVVPQPQDWELSRLIRTYWYSLLTTASLDAVPAGTPQWLPVDKVAGFPNAYNQFVFARPDRYPHFSSGVQVSYKQKQCDFLWQIGLREIDWWVN